METEAILNSIKKSREEWGTFRESLKAPIHRWFTYPAGFSYKAVEHSLSIESINTGMTIYDPFMGSGTVNVVAKMKGINSIGVEAHPFVFPITQCKMEWDIHFVDINRALEEIENATNIQRPDEYVEILKNEFPELVHKCYLPEALYELLIIKNSIKNLNQNITVTNFLNTALICALREISIAATGWPYIAPNKIKITSMSKQAFKTYKKIVISMYGDIERVRRVTKVDSKHLLILGDSRNTQGQIESNSVDHIFTSPPYLNNFDYADRTRLEMYFMGEAKNWDDISTKVRTKLITSATTQISRTDKRYRFSEEFKTTAPFEYEFLKEAVDKLASLRLIKGGKKSYDLMVVGYINDLFEILKDNYRVLKENTKAVYILGDSAPYGIHIPTDVLIGKIGKAIGFKDYQVDILRTRGGKWKDNPQRHNIALQESIVTLSK